MTIPEVLERIRGKDVFICAKPEILDFTYNARKITLFVSSKDVAVEITLPQEIKELDMSIRQIQHYLFSGDNKENPNVVIGWNIKNIFSYVLGLTKHELDCNSKIYDLKILESYIGIEGNSPQSFEEAVVRLKGVIKHQSWKHLNVVYNQIYTPLIKEVVPSMETIGMNCSNKQKLHSYYEIAAQLNGRMLCSIAYAKSYNPHNIGEEERSVFRAGMDYKFVYLDIKHMEVSVLQWLSGDESLKEIMTSGQDLYNGIWKKILNTDTVSEKDRQRCKDIFLPTMYGLGPTSMCEKLKINLESAKLLTARISDRFSGAYNWLTNQQNSMKNNVITDIKGRCRVLEENHYRARNFVVQSPASLACLSKLVKLYRMVGVNSKMGFHLHDGYGIFALELEVDKIIKNATLLMESEDELFPGLRFKVSCKSGSELNLLM
jgi:hypothetical protein